ncbi:hypothetical protein [Amycolatopsis sp. NPDC004079]|uniref:hypothetical protein n=1 Tax=Amycolatopsis sp. NPDC004079 TaxID=3154549 RepID=UPI0033AEF371
MATTAFACGHTVLVEAQFSRPDRACPACRREAWAENQNQRGAQREKARTAYSDPAAEARELLAGIEIPESAPAPLAIDWHSAALLSLGALPQAPTERTESGARGNTAPRPPDRT